MECIEILSSLIFLMLSFHGSCFINYHVLHRNFLLNDHIRVVTILNEIFLAFCLDIVSDWILIVAAHYAIWKTDRGTKIAFIILTHFLSNKKNFINGYLWEINESFAFPFSLGLILLFLVWLKVLGYKQWENWVFCTLFFASKTDPEMCFWGKSCLCFRFHFVFVLRLLQECFIAVLDLGLKLIWITDTYDASYFLLWILISLDFPMDYGVTIMCYAWSRSPSFCFDCLIFIIYFLMINLICYIIRIAPLLVTKYILKWYSFFVLPYIVYFIYMPYDLFLVKFYRLTHIQYLIWSIVIRFTCIFSYSNITANAMDVF